VGWGRCDSLKAWGESLFVKAARGKRAGFVKNKSESCSPVERRIPSNRRLPDRKSNICTLKGKGYDGKEIRSFFQERKDKRGLQLI
jgi:hypothetical protein